MTTYINTESDVYHIETDRHIDGNILYSDRHKLQTTNGKVTQTVAGGNPTKYLEYREGVGETARFRRITGFYQVPGRKNVLVDFDNHCLRLVDRTTQQTQTFVGTCTVRGYADGKHALFNYPWSVIPDIKNGDKLLVTDRHNRAVRHVDIKSTLVSTFYNDATLNEAFGITQEVSSGNLYLTTLTAVYQLHYLAKQLTLIAGSPTKRGYGDGSFSASLFSYITEPMLTDNGRKLLLANEDNNRLRVLDLESNTTFSLCAGTRGHKDGDMDSCTLDTPHSLMVSGHSLFIGENKKIRLILGT